MATRTGETFESGGRWGNDAMIAEERKRAAKLDMLKALLKTWEASNHEPTIKDLRARLAALEAQS